MECAASTLANDLKESCLCHYFTQNHLNAGFKNPPHSSWPSGFPSPAEKGEEKVVFSGRNMVRVFFLRWNGAAVSLARNANSKCRYAQHIVGHPMKKQRTSTQDPPVKIPSDTGQSENTRHSSRNSEFSINGQFWMNACCLGHFLLKYTLR